MKRKSLLTSVVNFVEAPGKRLSYVFFIILNCMSLSDMYFEEKVEDCLAICKRTTAMEMNI